MTTPDLAGLCERLRAPSNWLMQPRGKDWKSVVNQYDRAPFEAAAAIESLVAENNRLRDVLLGIAESDHYRRYPKQYEDGGVRGQSGLRAVRALTGRHGSYLNDDEVRRFDAEARTALEGASDDR